MLSDSDYSESLLVPVINNKIQEGIEFEKYFKLIPLPVIILKIKSQSALSVLYTNTAFNEQLNLEPEILNNQTLTESGNLPFSLDDVFNCFLTKDEITSQYFFPYKDNSLKVYENKYVLIESDIVGVFIKDITIADFSEADFLKNFNIFFENFPEKIIILDKNDVVIASNNRKIDFIDDYNIVGKHIQDCIPKRVRNSILNMLKEFKINPSAKFLDIHSKKVATLNYYSFSIYPFPRFHTIIFIKDISNERAVIKNVTQSTSFFNSVWEYSFDAMRLSDFDGNIVEVNKAYCHLTGMTREELIGKPFNTAEVNGDEDYDDKLKLYKKKFRKKIFNLLEEETINFKKSEEHILQIISSNIYILKEESSFKENLLLLTIYRDISDIKNAETELHKSEGLSKIGKMTAYISHELKSSITAIKINLDLLARNKEIISTHKRSFDVLKAEISRLEKIMKDILQYSKISYDKSTPVYLSSILEKIKSLMEPILIERRISLNNLLPQVAIMGVEKDLQTMLLQLIENSIESIKYDGKIDFYVKKTGHNLLSIFIEDTGSGIDDIDKVFEPFFTTKYSGTGLGLAITKKIIEQHNGYIKIESTREGETVFSLNFPKNNGIYGKNISN